jgi:glycolate oxidase
MAISDSLCKQIQEITGKEHISRQKEELLCYSYDATGIRFIPDAVVFPGSEQEVSKIAALASHNGIILVPRGAGTGMTGGSIPVSGGLVVVFSRMNNIIEIDENNFTARVQPGLIVSDLHELVEKKNLFYPPDPSSSSICTIGGTVGECAGGPRAVKYGVTRDYVLGLRAVLPSGDIIKTGVVTAKGVAGYDLTRLIVGSEGTLALITEITLKLLPRPTTVRTMLVLFDSMSTAACTVSAIIKKSIIPRCIEYLDEACLHLIRDLIRDQLDFDLEENTKALLIIETDGNSAIAEKESQDIKELCFGLGAQEVKLAQTPMEAQSLWHARKSLSPTLFKIAPHKINEDIVVPIDKIPDIVAETQNIRKKYDLNLVTFGHAGDGNIHCNIMYDKSDEKAQKRVDKAVDELFRATLCLGGTITGEHGVGITKKKFLPLEINKTEMALMKGIKKVFDPLNILNPGKIFSA